MTTPARILVIFVLFLSSIARAQEPQPYPAEFGLTKKIFHNDGDNKELSAIALLGGQNGLLGPDEGKRVYPISLDAHEGKITVGEAIKLTDAKGEIDIEGIAAGSDRYFIVGSHAISRKKVNYKPSAFSIWQLASDEKGVSDGDSDIRRSTLADFIALDPVLGPHYRKPLDKNGVNIEGLAYDVESDSLFAGFRAPNIEGKAFVLEVETDVVFGKTTKMESTLHGIELGIGYGIRDIIKVDQGFLILAGNSAPTDDTDLQFLLKFWDGVQPKVTDLADIRKQGAMPEALLLLKETEEAYDLLVVRDGAEDGLPTAVHVKKP